ncbi:hypothetical protein LguiB_023572 [Lonicera macranthoides]
MEDEFACDLKKMYEVKIVVKMEDNSAPPPPLNHHNNTTTTTSDEILSSLHYFSKLTLPLGVCVTGGTGYVASWLIMRLLQHGYSVTTTIRSNPDNKKDKSFLTNLPGASERLKIFYADLDKPESFNAPIEGCIGLFHVAHPIDFDDTETEETKVNRAVNGTLGILRACLNSKTVRRVVYTSSACTVSFHAQELAVIDESSWSDVDFIRAKKPYGASYYISKTLTERAALDFADEYGLDLVTVIPNYIHGPFICPQCPSSVRVSLAMIFGTFLQTDVIKVQKLIVDTVTKFSLTTCVIFAGDLNLYELIVDTTYVHIDDVVSAHVFLFENPKAKGRYICNPTEIRIPIDKLFEFLSARYPEYKIPPPK